LVLIFVTKYQFGPSIFFISIWSLFWEIWCNQVFSVSGVVTVLNWVSCVSFWIFEFFYYFLLFYYFLFTFLKLKKIKNLPCVKLISCHMAVTISRVTIMPNVIFSFSIWFLYFNFCLNLVPNFVKIVQFRPLQIETKINFYINVIQIFLLNLIFFIQTDIFIIYFQQN